MLASSADAKIIDVPLAPTCKHDHRAPLSTPRYGRPIGSNATWRRAVLFAPAESQQVSTTGGARARESVARPSRLSLRGRIGIYLALVLYRIERFLAAAAPRPSCRRQPSSTSPAHILFTSQVVINLRGMPIRFGQLPVDLFARAHLGACRSTIRGGGKVMQTLGGKQASICKAL